MATPTKHRVGPVPPASPRRLQVRRDESTPSRRHGPERLVLHVTNPRMQPSPRSHHGPSPSPRDASQPSPPKPRTSLHQVPSPTSSRRTTRSTPSPLPCCQPSCRQFADNQQRRQQQHNQTPPSSQITPLHQHTPRKTSTSPSPQSFPNKDRKKSSADDFQNVAVNAAKASPKGQRGQYKFTTLNNASDEGGKEIKVCLSPDKDKAKAKPDSEGECPEARRPITSIPQTNFAISLLVFCCFNPLFGVFAIYLSLTAAAAYRDGNKDKGLSRSRCSILMSLFGITITMVIVSSLVVYYAVSKHHRQHEHMFKSKGSSLGF